MEKFLSRRCVCHTFLQELKEIHPSDMGLAKAFEFLRKRKYHEFCGHCGEFRGQSRASFSERKTVNPARYLFQSVRQTLFSGSARLKCHDASMPGNPGPHQLRRLRLYPEFRLVSRAHITQAYPPCAAKSTPFSPGGPIGISPPGSFRSRRDMGCGLRECRHACHLRIPGL